MRCDARVRYSSSCRLVDDGPMSRLRVIASGDSSLILTLQFRAGVVQL